jgi:16S rRNA (cytosine1402-N4)-methyltransferase
MDLRPGMTVVDGTVGAGGHAAAFAAAISPGGTLVGLDRDSEILAHAEVSLRKAQEASAGGFEFELRCASYAEVGEVLEDLGLRICDRFFLDLGVSSLQLNSATRGFSFMQDGPLDMRMDQAAGKTAAEWLRSVSEKELSRVLYEYGEERYSRRIARGIVAGRRRRPIETTGHLVEMILDSLPGPARRQKIHPATRSFQALRLVINDELGHLERGLEAGLEHLAPEGRIAAISFHSLEDRLVKRFLREQMQLPFRKPMIPGEDEIEKNPRSRSAKLRCGIRRSE